MSDVNKMADKTTAIGVLQIFAGALLILLFWVISMVSRVLSLVNDASSALSTTLLIASVVIGGFVIYRGYVNYKLASRFRRIYRAMGDDTYMNLTQLEQKLGWSKEKLQTALRRQISYGFWPESFLDTDNGVFVLGYDPAQSKSETGNKAVDEILGTAYGLIHDMVTVNRSIEDEQLKAKADTLVETAKQIYGYIEKSPEKSGLVRQMTNYLLPTTINLFRDYVELQEQTIKSDNMIESMQKINDMTNTIDAAFKKQLNILYEEKAMDVSAELEVMQNIIDI